MDSTVTPPASHDYGAASDLSRLCLPQEYKDSNRRLAWANSICLLFLLIGCVGLKPPPVQIRPLSEVVDIVPVVITPPEETKPPEPSEQPPEPQETTPEFTPDTPVVATVVAASPAAAAFAVPVEGPVVLAPVRYAAPPPPKEYRPPPPAAPTKYVPSVSDWSGHPRPDYPGYAQRMGYQGTTVLQITVDPSGAITDVQIKKSSGYKVLDEAALEHVRKYLRLRNPPGEVRVHTLDMVWRLQ